MITGSPLSPDVAPNELIRLQGYTDDDFVRDDLAQRTGGDPNECEFDSLAGDDDRPIIFGSHRRERARKR